MSDIADKLTVCITAFMRPESLCRCLDSLDKRYPNVPRIVTETNGNTSYGRAAGVAQATTPYVMICEDDLEFDRTTRLESLIAVLESDQECGGAAGWLKTPGKFVQHYYANLRRFRGRLLQERPDDWTATPDGVGYCRCDLLSNCGIWRREVFADCPWDCELEVQEHKEWFWRLKQGEKWRCAYVPSVAMVHRANRSDPAYREMLKRESFRPIAEGKIGAKLTSFSGFTPIEQPCIVVMGVGHANTTVTTRQLEAAGWNLGDADEKYAENRYVHGMNAGYLHGNGFDRDKADQVLRRLRRPWAIKDPRFSHGALRPWLASLAPYRPLLLWVTKDESAVKMSYERRGEHHLLKFLPRWQAECERQYSQWPWSKIRLDASGIAAACELWKTSPQSDVSGWTH